MMLASRFGRILLTLVLLTFPLKVRAQAPPTLTLLVLEAPVDAAPQAEQITILLKELLANSAIVQLTDEPELTMSDMLLLNGCEVDTPECLDIVSVNFETQQFLYGKVERFSSTQLMVRLRVYDRPTNTLKPIYTQAIDQDELETVLREDLSDLLTGTLWELPAFLTLTTSSPVTTSVVLLDGLEIGSLPITRHKVQSGSHNLRVQAEGYRVWTETLDFDGGQLLELSPRLERLGNADADPPDPDKGGGSGPTPPDPTVDTLYQPPLTGWILLGLGGAMLTGAAVTGILVLDAESEHADEVRQRQALELQEYAENLALTTNILLTVGAITVLASGLTFLFMGEEIPVTSNSTTSAFTPSSFTATPLLDGGAYLELGWQF